MKQAAQKQCVRLKNVLCVLLSAALAAGALSACSGAVQPQTQQIEPEETVVRVKPAFPQYKVKSAAVSDGGEAVLVQQATEDGFLAFINRKVREEIPAELLEDPDFVNDGRYAVYESSLFHLSKSGKRSKIRRYRPLPAPENPDGRKEYFSESRALAFRILEDGNIAALESSFESWQNEGRAPRYETRSRYYIRVLQPNGTEISTCPVETEPNGYGLDGGHLVALQGGLLAVPQGKAVLVIDTEGKRQFTVETPFPVSELCAAGSQSLAVTLKQDEQCWFSLIDVATRNVTVPMEIPADAHDFCMGADAGSLHFVRRSEVFSLDTATGETRKVVSLLSLGVNPSELGALAVREDGTLSILVNHWDPDEETVKTRLVTASPVPSSATASAETQPEQLMLTLGFLELSDQLEEALINFNAAQNAVRIEAVDYGNLSEEQLLMDEPDIVVMDDALYRRLAGERKLADLSELLRSDREYGEGSIFASVRQALQEEDGTLRRMAGVFRIETMACDADTVEGRTELSVDALRAILLGMPDGSRLYEPYYTSDRLLDALTLVNRRELVSGGQHNAALYEKLNSFAALQPQHYDYTSYAADPSSMEKRIYDGRLLMLQAHIGNLEELKWYDAFFPSEASFVGWPTEDGSHSVLCFDEMLGIGQNCTRAEQEAVWQFVRMILEDGYSDRCYGFPVRVSALEKLMADDAAAISYRIDEDGEFELDDEGEQIERARSSWYSPEWRRHYEYALTDAQRAKLLQIIENAV